MLLEFLLLLFLAVLNVAIFRRLYLPAILAYLFTGVIIGPVWLDLFSDFHGIELLAELGIVFLMFSLGLEFSLPKLLKMRHWVFGLGGAQVFICSVAFFYVALLCGLSWQQSLVVAGALSMSSTAIIIKQLTELRKLHTRRGKLAISVLLFQDLSVVPLLIVVPIIGQPEFVNVELGGQLMIALAKGLAAVCIILAVGKWVLPKVFHEVASARSDELFVMSTLLVALLASGLTLMLGLSMALGAFLAGMMLGESHYKHQLESDIRPFRDVLMGLFFVTIGMLFDLDVILQYWWQLLLLIAAVMVFKILLIAGLAKVMRVENSDALATGIMLCQVGEFGFVLVSLAGKYQILSAQVISIVLAIGVCSMAMTPWLVRHCRRMSLQLLQHDDRLLKRQKPLPGEFNEHVIICGYGRVGQTIARFLSDDNIAYVAIDRDPIRLTESVKGGDSVAFGDACRRDILLMLGVEKAKLVIITFDHKAKALSILACIQDINPDAKVLIRTKNDSAIAELKAGGATEVVPEVLEGSLMLVSHVLLMSGIPISRIIKKMQRERKNQYQHLHGFFHGETSENNLEHRSRRLHAVELAEDADAVGKTVAELHFPHVTIQEVRRDKRDLLTQFNPSELVLQSGDLVLLCGESQAVDIAESTLLNGV